MVTERLLDLRMKSRHKNLKLSPPGWNDGQEERGSIRSALLRRKPYV